MCRRHSSKQEQDCRKNLTECYLELAIAVAVLRNTGINWFIVFTINDGGGGSGSISGSTSTSRSRTNTRPAGDFLRLSPAPLSFAKCRRTGFAVPVIGHVY